MRNLDPENLEASIALLRARKTALLAGDAAVRALASGLPSSAAAVVEGWQREAVGDWAGLRALDARLAASTIYDPQYPDGVRLRALWRVEAGDPGLAREAVLLLDRMVRLSTDPADWQLRTRAGAAARIPRPRS
jgi:hypothetical protein